MRTRDPEAKRRQLLDAALAEFSEYGIAGARVDRIAKRAGVSAGLVYTHFGSKDDLFEAVYEAIVVQAVDEMPITPDDLPGYAGTLFDAALDQPEAVRLATWHRLERATRGHEIASVTAAMKAKAEAIRTAQAAGTVTDRLDADQLLVLVLTIATMWSVQSPEETGFTSSDRDYRRTTVTEAVRRLVEP